MAHIDFVVVFLIFRNMDMNLEGLPMSMLKKHVVGKNIFFEYEFELIRRITQKNEFVAFVKEARNFFLTDFSHDFLEFIAVSICKKENSSEILGEYYEFISKKDLKTETPYYKLTLYKGKNNASLQSYVSIITTRYFTTVEAKEDKKERKIERIDASSILKIDISSSEVIDNPWFTILIDRKDEDYLDNHDQSCQSLRKALDMLPERESLILKLMVMGDASALEAFEDLEPYIAETSKTPTSTWSDKQKQDAISLLKGRALKHLKKILKNEGNA